MGLNDGDDFIVEVSGQFGFYDQSGMLFNGNDDNLPEVGFVRIPTISSFTPLSIGNLDATFASFGCQIVIDDVTNKPAPSGGGGSGCSNAMSASAAELQATIAPLAGGNHPTAIDDTDGQLLAVDVSSGTAVPSGAIVGNVIENDTDPDGDGIFAVAQSVRSEEGLLTYSIGIAGNGDISFNYSLPDGQSLKDTAPAEGISFHYTIVDEHGGFDEAKATVFFGPPPDPVVVKLSPQNGDLLDFVEGGEDLFITVELSKAISSPIVIRPSHGFIADLSIQSELVVPAGETRIDLPLGFAKSEIAVSDFSVEAASESGSITFEALIDDSPIEISAGDQLRFVIREEVTTIPPPQVTQDGFDAAALLRQQLKVNGDISEFITIIDPTLAEELYIANLKKIADAVEPAFILNDATKQLEADLELADSLLQFNIEDPARREANQIAYAVTRYDAFKRVFVDTVDELAAFAFAANSAAFASGFIAGLAVGGAVVSLPVTAAVVIGAVVVGQAADLTYNEFLRGYVREAAGAAFEFDNPRAAFMNNTIDELNLTVLDPEEPTVTGGDLIPTETEAEPSGPDIEPDDGELEGNQNSPETPDTGPDPSEAEDSNLRQKGDAAADRLVGASMNDTLVGGGGNDTLIGKSGDDNLRGGGGDDRIRGGGGEDNIKGGGGADNIRGGGSDDVISGNRGSDDIKGGGGDDTINAGRGDDTLKGNGGDDTFVFRRGDGSDTINGFQQDRDLIEITSGASDFDNLVISQEGRNVVIEFANVDITITNAQTSQFNEDDYIFA